MKQIKNIKLNNGNRGYAILFTLVVISIISMISMGLASAALKQVILSGVARDSTTAFYEADLGSECTMYGDRNSDTIPFPSTINQTLNWTCAGHSLDVTKTSDGYTINPQSIDNNKCFTSTIIKTMPSDYILTEVNVYGYNICDKSNLRTVERALRITY